MDIIAGIHELLQEAISKKLPPYILKQLSTCENALRSARDNLENLKAVIFTICFASLVTRLETQLFRKLPKSSHVILKKRSITVHITRIWPIRKWSGYYDHTGGNVIFIFSSLFQILAAKGTQLELQKFDKETKALLDEINSLSAAIGRTKQTSGDQEVKVSFKELQDNYPNEQCSLIRRFLLCRWSKLNVESGDSYFTIAQMQIDL